MNIGSNYAQPVYVNGFRCNNCTDVEYAKKHIDPAHPKSGPYNINAATDPTRRNDPAVRFDGALGDLKGTDSTDASNGPAAPAYAPGSLFDLSA